MLALVFFPSGSHVTSGEISDFQGNTLNTPSAVPLKLWLPMVQDSRLTSSILHVGFHEEFYFTLGGKLANFHKTDLTAVDSSKTLWLCFTPLVVLYTISKIHNVADTARY